MRTPIDQYQVYKRHADELGLDVGPYAVAVLGSRTGLLSPTTSSIALIPPAGRVFSTGSPLRFPPTTNQRQWWAHQS